MASLTPSPLPSVSQNATPPSSPTNSSTTPPAPSPQSSSAPPPSPPPETSPPPPSSVAPPPSSPPSSSPPPSTTLSPPPAPPTASPPSTNSPPPLTASPPQPSPSENSPLPASPAIPVAPPPSNSSLPPESPATPVAPSLSPPATSSSPPPPTTSPPPPSRARPPENSPPAQPETPPLPPAASPPPPSRARPPENSPPAQPATPPLPPAASPPSPSNRSSFPSTPSIAPPSNNTLNNGSLPAVPLPPARPPPFRPADKPTDGSTQPSQNIVSPNNSGGLNGAGVAAVGSIAGLLALSLVALAVWFIHKRKKRKELFSLRYTMPSPFASSQNSGSSVIRSNHSTQLTGSVSASNTNYKYSPDGGGGIGSSRPWFSYQELFEVTNGFSEYNILGEGGFGCVYKGVLSDGREVAVKQLKAGSGQGEREFQAEVEIISRIHHRHLVSLVGYCISENQRLLVYDYVPNDTLHHHLHAQGKQAMDWASRVKVAAGAARGMAYLHEDCQPRIIHRDIKSTNILLENNFEARVADFGLAKLALDLDIQTHVSTRVMGTFGYMAPEYASSGKLTEKSDVYSFGVVLLELITGRKPVDSSQPVGDESLVEWARPLLTEALDKEEFGDIVDPRLEDNFVPSEMFRMIEAAAACVRHLAAKRPKMSQVARALDSMDELADLNNGVKPGESGIFNSREHSAQLKVFQRMAFGSQDYSSGYVDNSQSSWRS